MSFFVAGFPHSSERKSPQRNFLLVAWENAIFVHMEKFVFDTFSSSFPQVLKRLWKSGD